MFHFSEVIFLYFKRVDKGEIPPSMLFTPVIRCIMEKFN